ncbi:MAG: CARDB domain-containing protein [Candidatus Paceibacterota bacterium]|jgi:hypothetical protein
MNIKKFLIMFVFIFIVIFSFNSSPASATKTLACPGDICYEACGSEGGGGCTSNTYDTSLYDRCCRSSGTFPAPLYVNLSASETTVPYGNRSILSWDSGGGTTSCIAPWTTSVATSNPGVSVLPSISGSYWIECKDQWNNEVIDSKIIIVTPTGSISSASSCTIPIGASTCNSIITWTSGGSNDVTLIKSNANLSLNDPSIQTLVSSSISGTTSTSINGSTLFRLRYMTPTDAIVELDSETVNASCAIGSTWNGTICAPNTAVPTCTTPTATSITSTSATIGGNITSDGGATITSRGVAISTTTNPTGGLPTVAGTTGIFSRSATGLTAGTTYHYRAWATNSAGTGYCPDTTFMTAPSLPDLTAGSISPTTATVDVSKTFSATISNIGAGSTGASFSYFFQKSDDKEGGGTTSDLSSSTMSTLASGGSSTATVSASFPSTGTYSMRLCADKSSSSNTGTITESNEGNNCGDWTDIVVSASVENGSCSSPSVHYSCDKGTSTNNVDGATSWTWDCVSLNGGTTAHCTELKVIDGGWTDWSAWGTCNEVFCKQTRTRDCTNPAPSGDGVYCVGDSSELRSCFTGPCGFPDLTANSASPTSATAGVGRTYSATITNDGGIATASSFSYFFQKARVENSMTIIDDLTPGTITTLLAPGGTKTVTSPSITFSPAGTYYVRVCSDKNSSADTGVIAESNLVGDAEMNNCGAWQAITVTDPPRPDLTAGSVVPTTATVNVGQTYTASVSNIGPASTGSSFSYVFQKASDKDGGGTVLVLIPAGTMSTLASGASATATSPSVTFTLAGTYSIRVCADKSSSSNDGTITESNEDNNCGDWTNIVVRDIATVPTCTSPTATSITSNSATLGGNITSNGGAFITERGTCWGASVNPMTNCTAEGGASTGVFSHTRTGLSPSTFYYYNIYAKNSVGTGFCSGSAVNFTTTATPLPDLTVGSVTPTNVVVNTNRTYSATITNSGNASTENDFSYFFQKASGKEGGGTITDLTPGSTVKLSSGANVTVTSPSVTFTPVGTYSMRLCADKSSRSNAGVITESNEDNNCGDWTDIVVSASVENGSCSSPSIHYSCNKGTSTNNVDGATSWTWDCVSLNSGTTAHCSQTKASGTITATSCTIAENASTCPSTVTWTVSNLIVGAQTAVTRNNPANTSIFSDASYNGTENLSGTTTSNINYGESTFYLYHNGAELAHSIVGTSDFVTASCTGGTAWNGSACVSTLVNGTCSSPATHYNCATGTSTNNVEGASWTWDCAGSNGGATASCTEINSEFGNEPEPEPDPLAMSGTLTAATPSCVIQLNQNSCNINFSWTTTNPEIVGGSAITKPVNITVASGDSGTNVPLAVKYNSETFYLYNNEKELASKNVTSTCVSGTAWDGSKCSTIVLSPNTSISADPATIVIGDSSVITWSSTRATSCSSTGSGFDVSGATSGSITVSPTATTTYHLLCVGPGGQTPDEVTITVTTTGKKPIYIEH